MQCQQMKKYEFEMKSIIDKLLLLLKYFYEELYIQAILIDFPNLVCISVQASVFEERKINNNC